MRLFLFLGLATQAALATTPSNDDACSPTTLPLDGTPVDFDSTLATAEADEVSPGAGTNGCNSIDGWCGPGFADTDVQNSLWHAFVGPASQCVSIQTGPAAGEFFIVDTQLAVHTTTDCADFSLCQEIGANDDSGPGNAGGLFGLCVVPGVTCSVQADGWRGRSGMGQVVAEDCSPEPLAVELGDCQSRIINDMDDEIDFNYVVPSLTGGTGNFACSWSGDGIAQDDGCLGVILQPLETTECCLTVEDLDACFVEIVTSCVAVEVLGSCGNKGKKVEVCNVPPGNPESAKEICVSPNALKAQLAKSESYVGPCEPECTATGPTIPWRSGHHHRRASAVGKAEDSTLRALRGN